MRPTYIKFGVLAALVAGPLVLSGCAQTPAQPVCDACAAKADADRAMQTAEQALQVANKAAADAQAANDKIDRMFQRGLRK